MAEEYKLSYTAQEIDEKLGQISIPDWEQNDPQGEGYIKNRPFYSEGSAITFEPTTENITVIDSTFELIAGQSYKVSFTLNDGSITSQILVAKTFNEMADTNIPNGDKMICIASDGDYDEDFNLINNCAPVDGNPAYVEGSAVYELTNCVSATLNVGEIKTIDTQYLPDYISKTETINEIQKATNEIQNEVTDTIQNEVNKVKSEIKDEIPQSDYEENDDTSKSYIKNRPFYTKTGTTPTIETFYDSLNGDPTVDYVEREGFDSIQAVLTPSTSVQQYFKEGAEITYTLELLYDLTSDGGVGSDTRTGIVQKYSDELLYVGDAWLVEENRPAYSEPWYCITYNINTNEITIYVYTVRFGAYSGANVTLSSSYIKDEIKQLDPKFIPDYISKTEVEELVSNNTSGKSIDSITTDENNNVIVTFSDGTTQVLGQLNVDVQADFLTSGGFGNLRFTDNKFQYYDEATSQWVDTQMTSENVTIMNLSPQPMQTFSANFNPDTKNVELYINESADTIIGGQTASTVEKVIIRRKKDTFPVDENDGDLILITERKNFGAYKRVPYIDTIEGVQMGETYCYKAFPINNIGLVGYSASNESKFTTKDYWLFGFKLDQNESDPASMIRYIEDNEGYQSAYMDYDTDKFNYGSWENAWFMKVKPCMLNYDGTVAYYLNPKDYTLKEDGTASDIANASFGGNAMVGIPKTYWKIIDNGDDTANIYFSNKKLDENFVCWSHIDNNGNEIDYCYVPIYNGYSDGTRLRSLSGKAPMHSQTGITEINLAKANNQDDNIIWYTEVYSDRMLINLLLLLIGKSTDTQTIFGNGYIYDTNFSNSNPTPIKTGIMDNKGLFWGKGSEDYMSGLKVFGIEHWWGYQWRRIAGWISDKGTQKIKLTYGQFDGSTIDEYNIDGSGYISIGCTPTGANGGYISKIAFTKYGLIPTTMSGSTTTYYTDGMWFINSQISYLAVGGDGANKKYLCGAMTSTFDSLASHTSWKYNANISCKPLAPIEEVE